MAKQKTNEADTTAATAVDVKPAKDAAGFYWTMTPTGRRKKVQRKAR